MWKKILMASVMVSVVILSIISLKFKDSRAVKQVVPGVVVVKSQSDLPLGEIKEYEVQTGDTFVNAMGNMGVPYQEALTIMDSSKGVFDFTKMNAGKLLKLVFVNEALAAVEYPLNSDTVIHVKKQEASFAATEEDIPYAIETSAAKGIITDSLFAAAKEVGIEDKITLKIADIFSSDVDFATDIEKSDSFSVLYEKRTLDGKPASAGKVLAARFTNGTQTFMAYRFNDKFYNEKGESLTRQFLRSPLNYAFISSGFSYQRTHPVTKQVTPHRAIDYAASSGTPVIATADGFVTTAGSKGGLGITVELKHGNYMTQYAHLSGIAKGVKKGAEIFQGDVIGYVGSTGISTGPHLQYAMFNNNNPINPLDSNFSRSVSIADFEKESFEVLKSKLDSQLR